MKEWVLSEAKGRKLILKANNLCVPSSLLITTSPLLFFLKSHFIYCVSYVCCGGQKTFWEWDIIGLVASSFTHWATLTALPHSHIPYFPSSFLHSYLCLHWFCKTKGTQSGSDFFWKIRCLAVLLTLHPTYSGGWVRKIESSKLGPGTMLKLPI